MVAATAGIVGVPVPPNFGELSLAERLAHVPEERRRFIASLTPEQASRLAWSWKFWGRPKQQAPLVGWKTWLILAGRGWGKTRTGAEQVRAWVEAGVRRIALVGRTAADVRDVMIHGPSGILAISPPWNRPEHFPSKRVLIWPNGAMAHTYTAEKPDELRGPQHEKAWGDEVAAWRYPDAWDQLQFGLRLGDDPQAVVTTTPRPTPLVRALVADETTYVTTGSSYENRANLAADFFSKIIKKYEGTRLGLQELYARILSDIPGALWTIGMLEKCRVTPKQLPAMKRIVVSIDPSATDSDEANETGITVAGLGADGFGYVLEDVSGTYSPNAWATRAVKAYHDWKADRIIAEKNNGGDMVRTTIETVDKKVPVRLVWASKGKHTRAEPVSSLYEKGWVKHCGVFSELEDQLCLFTQNGWQGDGSPDRGDSLVWGITDLMLGHGAELALPVSITRSSPMSELK